MNNEAQNEGTTHQDETAEELTENEDEVKFGENVEGANVVDHSIANMEIAGEEEDTKKEEEVRYV